MDKCREQAHGDEVHVRKHNVTQSTFLHHDSYGTCQGSMSIVGVTVPAEFLGHAGIDIGAEVVS